jgi:acetyltransferase-like isoleucine patch superfamily enzyme
VTRIVGTALNRLAFFCPGGSSVRPRLQRWRGARIGRNVWLGLYVYVDDLHPEALSIGDNCTIGIRTTILTHFYWGPRRPASNGKVVIEKDVFIGPHCVILPNVKIGEGAVIKAGTVVAQSVPPHTFWGAPAAGALGEVGVPLTAEHGYSQFLRGMRPLARP